MSGPHPPTSRYPTHQSPGSLKMSFDAMASRERAGWKEASYALLGALILLIVVFGRPVHAELDPNAAGLEGVSNEELAAITKLYEAAITSGKTTVNLYSAGAPTDPNDGLGILLREFERTFPGITVLGTQISGAALAARLEAEFASGNRQGDVVGDPDEYIDSGYVEQFEPVTTLKLGTDVRDENGYFASPVRKLFGLVYNTDLVPADEVPDTIEGILIDKWRGQVTIAQPTGVESIDEAIAILLSNDAISVETIQKLADFVPPSDRQVKASSSVNLVAQGRYAFGIWGPNQVAARLADRGAPIAAAPFKEGVLRLSPLGLLKDAPSPDAGKLLLTWLYTPTAQRLYATLYEYPTTPGAPTPTGLPDQSDYSYQPLAAAESADTQRRYFEEIVEPIFGTAK
ncbi:ABC transporter substrate-binding protein [Pseudochelatococcus sp. B33]